MFPSGLKVDNFIILHSLLYLKSFVTAPHLNQYENVFNTHNFKITNRNATFYVAKLFILLEYMVSLLPSAVTCRCTGKTNRTTFWYTIYRLESISCTLLLTHILFMAAEDTLPLNTVWHSSACRNKKNIHVFIKSSMLVSCRRQ